MKEAEATSSSQEPMEEEQTSAKDNAILEIIITETISDSGQQTNLVGRSMEIVGCEEKMTALVNLGVEHSDDVIVNDVEEDTTITETLLAEDSKQLTEDDLVEVTA